MSGGSQFGRWCLLIGRSSSDGRGSTPQPEAADSSVRADDETNVTDRSAQRQLGLIVQVSVMGAELQEDRKHVTHSSSSLNKETYTVIDMTAEQR